MRDNRVGYIENFFGRTVISFEFENLRVFKVVFKPEYVVYIRAAPTVNTLVVVADGKYVAVL